MSLLSRNAYETDPVPEKISANDDASGQYVSAISLMKRVMRNLFPR